MHALMRPSFLALFFSWLIISGCQQPGWQEFRCEEGGFSALLPGTPAKVTHRVDSPAGPLDIQVFTLEHRRFTYVLSYTDYPEAALQAKTPEDILNGARQGAVANVQGRLVSETALRLSPYPGREAVIAVPDGHQVRLRFFLVKNRLYQAGVATPKDRTHDPEVTRFLESFTIRQPWR